MIWLETAFGFVLLFAGGEFVVRSAVGLAHRLRVRPALIGLTAVAMGTSLPEVFVSLKAALIGAPAIAIGNVVGSNIANVLLVVGASGLLTTIAFGRGLLKRDGVAVIVATLVFLAVAATGEISRPVAGAFLASLIIYIVLCYRMERRDAAMADLHAREAAEFADLRPLWQNLVMLAFGFSGVLLGAELLITGAVEIARLAGLSEAVIGLTLVAIGTSLPEMATSAIAAWRGHGDVAMANILGSNLFNLLGILGVVGLVVPLPVPEEIVRFDNWAMLGVTLAFVWLAVRGSGFSRPLCGLFLLAYGVYLATQFVGFSGVELAG
ncbi:MAG: calcium/sodium antiporter [Alphaproteobacteria bacterium]|nr:calcium/sodium antiporter [Alphaproteobacteria bacterium]